MVKTNIHYFSLKDSKLAEQVKELLGRPIPRDPKFPCGFSGYFCPVMAAHKSILIRIICFGLLVLQLFGCRVSDDAANDPAGFALQRGAGVFEFETPSGATA